MLLFIPADCHQIHVSSSKSHPGAELQGGPCGPRTTLRSGQPRRIGTVGTGESACVPLSLLRSAFLPMPIASDCAPSFPCGCAVSHRILLCACGAAVGAGDVATASTAIGHRQLHDGKRGATVLQVHVHLNPDTKTQQLSQRQLACC